MTENDWVLVGIALWASITSLIGWVLKRRDDAQTIQIKSSHEDIDRLWEVHQEDVKLLTDLRIKVASDYHEKGELDAKLERLENSFTRGFDTLGVKFDKLSDALLRHVDEAHAS